MLGAKYIPLILLLLVVPASAEHKVCGSPPEFENRTREITKRLGDLDGKAAGFAKLLGSAELGGRVTSERQTLYKDSQPAEAARYDAYLAYVFCVTIMDDTKADMAAKLKALQDFRKPVSELSLPDKVTASFRDSVAAASQRAQAEAVKATKVASAYPGKDVGYTMRRVLEVEQSVRDRAGKQANVHFDNGTDYWGEMRGDTPNGVGRQCCAAGDAEYIGEYARGQMTGYGRMTFADTTRVTAKFTLGIGSGAGCIVSDPHISLCGVLDGSTNGYYQVRGTAMVQVYASDYAQVVEVHFGQVDGNFNPTGACVSLFISDVSPDAQMGARFEGEMSGGMRDGYGVMYYPDGTRYEGQWQADKIRGFGQKVGSDGKVISSGYWQDGSVQIALL